VYVYFILVEIITFCNLVCMTFFF